MKKLMLVLGLSLGLSFSGKAENVKPVKMSLVEWISGNVKYPSSAAENKEEGTVYISFSLGQNGNAINVEIEKGISTELNNEALRLVSEMHMSSVIGLNNIDKRYIIPIKFILR